MGRVMSRRPRDRRALSREQLVELVLGGPAEGEASVFATARDRERAELAFANEREGWDSEGFDELLFRGPVLKELSRRHHEHWSPGHDHPVHRALFDPVHCIRCNPNGYLA